MKVVASVAEMRAVPGVSGRRVLVPTMGALHEGHLSLVARAREIAGDDGQVVVSLFVNPIQFDRASDLDGYPRPIDEDLRMCSRAGVDVVFLPEVASMYHPDRSVTVSESQLSGGLCGAARPGHFDGVCTVVLKLFNICGCDAAVFGEKDFQQLAVIRRMVRDLDVPVEIIGCPTVRETDGLAMSSRNRRLTPEQRGHAAGIHRALAHAAEADTVDEVLGRAQKELGKIPGACIDYLELVDAESLQSVDRLVRPAVLAAAVFFDDVRLIDHVHVAAAR